jgi:hypothetical protein
MGSFSFFVGMPYLESTVGEFVRKVVGAGESLTFEVDPAKETSAEKRSKNRVVLKEWTCLVRPQAVCLGLLSHTQVFFSWLKA